MFTRKNLLKRLIDRCGPRRDSSATDVAEDATASAAPLAVNPAAQKPAADGADMAEVAREKFPASPIMDIPFAVVDLSTDSCIDDILASSLFAATANSFAKSLAASRALVSFGSQALFYTLLRNMGPEHVVEIGTYRAATTEAMCRALHANGRGLVHTIEPYVAEWVPHIIAQWPQELRDRVRFYPMNSAAFFAQCRFRPDFVFIDGHHDFEYALFDMQATARVINPGGLVVIDNISQPGPFLAARQFCRDNPGWSEIGRSLSNYRQGKPFDPHRSAIATTDCCVLRAPPLFSLDSQPIGLPTVHLAELRKISIVPVGAPKGLLHVQCILRTFSDPPFEQTVERSVMIDGGPQTISFDPPIHPAVAGAPFTVELWLCWAGSGPLTLASAPVLR
jgi:predicted O-methyltransferase YrrM